MKFTNKQIEQAKVDVARKNSSIDMAISPRMYVTFGTQGLSVTKCNGNKTSKRKFVNRWRIKSAAEINEELKSQEWQ